MPPSLCVSVCAYASVFVIAFLVYVRVALDMRPPALMREDSGLDPSAPHTPPLLLSWISLPDLSGIC